MKTILEILNDKMEAAFTEAGYDKKYGLVRISNRQDLCEFQCSGAMPAAKEYKTAPIKIAGKIVEILSEDKDFSEVSAVMPGFINLRVDSGMLAGLVCQMRREDKFGLNSPDRVMTIIVDYGGANVAKALHVGHLRPAIIGESIKRISRFMGHKVIGDVHLGDWGLQIGLIITELRRRQPELPYFIEGYSGEFPAEPPFTISDLEELYPFASARSKEDEDYKKEAQEATAELQSGNPAYKAIWQHIVNVSVADLKSNYNKLNVEFDLWKKESDAEPYIPDMVKYLKENGYAVVSDGALVVDISEDGDKKELPPCLIVKSNGATLYATTDLATIVERMKLFHPDLMIYITDKRQELHFTQVFRTARKSKLIHEDTECLFIGHGTMNGKDGKPFKTRDGGLLRLETLIEQINGEVYRKMKIRDFTEEEGKRIAEQVGLAAIKYGDLSNQPAKDYVFDLERFASFEGNTGPYLLYTVVRIKSLLNKYRASGGVPDGEMALQPPQDKSEREIYLMLLRFTEVIETAFTEKAPNRICVFMYELADAFNRFYHDHSILGERDEKKKISYLGLIQIIKDVLETCLDLLGLEVPGKM